MSVWALLHWRAHKWQLGLAGLLAGLTSVASIGLLGTSGYLISKAAFRPAILELMLPIVMVRFFSLARASIRYCERMSSHDLVFRLLSRLRCWLYERLEPRIPGQRTQHHTGDLLTRFVADVETLQDLPLRLAVPVTAAVIVTLLVAIGLAQIDLIASAALLTGLVLAGVVLPWLTWLTGRTAAQAQIAQRAALQRHLVDGVAGMEDVWALSLEPLVSAEWEKPTRRLAELQRRQAWIGAAQAGAAGLLVWLTMLSVLWLLSPKVSTGQVSPFLFVGVGLAVLASFEVVQPLPTAFQFLGQAREAGNRVSELIEQPCPIADPAVPRPVPQNPAIKFIDVSFSYLEADRPALQNVSFHIPFGSKVAVVGPSGSGKSTLVSLICRFFDPGSGTVLLGPHPLAEYAVRDVRAQVAVVLQNPHIFNSTIRANLLLARPEARDEELLTALDHAGLGEFVRGLPLGLNTATGSEGLNLSGGQRQRLALAQALLKPAPIIILDEGTASLDAPMEQDILQRLFWLSEGRTLIVITHRPELVPEVDQVLCLRDGRLQTNCS